MRGVEENPPLAVHSLLQMGEKYYARSDEPFQKNNRAYYANRERTDPSLLETIFSKPAPLSRQAVKERVVLNEEPIRRRRSRPLALSNAAH